MVNFRYHLVSLISVFVALAIGVVLGAGPLQTKLNTATQTAATGMSPSETTKAALEAAEGEVEAGNLALATISDRVLPGTLKGRAVATIVLPGSEDSDVQRVQDELVKGGATIAGSVTLTDNWDSQNMSQYRATLSAPLSSHLGDRGIAGASSDTVIGSGIVTVLTSDGTEQAVIKEILTDKTTPIMSLTQDPNGSANTIVVIGPRAPQTQGDNEGAGNAGGRVATAWGGLATAITTAPNSGVVLGDGSSRDSLIAQVRSQKIEVTTVDSVSSYLGAFSTALALKDASVDFRAFGVQEGATEVLPKLPTIDSDK